MKLNNILKVLGLSIAFIAVVSIIVVRAFFLPQVEVGIVEYKMISGSIDGNHEHLLIETADGNTFLTDRFAEEDYLDLLSGKSDLEDICFRVSVNLCGSRDYTLTLYVDNINYKIIRPDTIIKFEIDKKDRDYLVRLVD
jgi:hypothetical protein